MKWNSNMAMTGLTFFFALPPKMMCFFNGQERTITYYGDLLKQAGWKLSAVHYDAPSVVRFQKMVAVPI
jgi:hypothetical protein